jgi:cytochrome c biogenesis protein
MGPALTVEKRESDQPLQSFKLFQRFPNFDRERRDQYLLQFRGLSEKKWTGLQVAKDPGVPLIWIGSGLMILGLYLSFFVFHRRLWVRVRPAGPAKLTLEIFGHTRKAEGNFQKEIQRLSEAIGREIETSSPLN